MGRAAGEAHNAIRGGEMATADTANDMKRRNLPRRVLQFLTPTLSLSLLPVAAELLAHRLRNPLDRTMRQMRSRKKLRLNSGFAAR